MSRARWDHTKAEECSWEAWHYDGFTKLFVLRVDADGHTCLGKVNGRLGFWVCSLKKKDLEPTIFPLSTPIDDVLDAAQAIGRIEGLI